LPESELRLAVFEQIPREQLEKAVTLVGREMSHHGPHYYDQLVHGYRSLRHFLPTLLQTVAFQSALDGADVLSAWQFLYRLDHEKPKPNIQDAPQEGVSGAAPVGYLVERRCAHQPGAVGHLCLAGNRRRRWSIHRMAQKSSEAGDMTIAWFNEVGATDVHLVGGKGANLGEMTAAGLPVPPGFCVTVAGYQQLIQEAGLWPQIEALLAAVPEGDVAGLATAAAAIRGLNHGSGHAGRGSGGNCGGL
jgi:hypothetical protein